MASRPPDSDGSIARSAVPCLWIADALGVSSLLCSERKHGTRLAVSAMDCGVGVVNGGNVSLPLMHGAWRLWPVQNRLRSGKVSARRRQLRNLTARQT